MQVLSLKTTIGSLLVPVSMVAQILSRGDMNEYGHDENFVRHSIGWREYEIPLLYSSEMLGAVNGSDVEFERSVILWPLQGAEKTDLFSLTSLDSPKVVNVENNLSTIKASDDITALCENGELKNYLGLISLENTLGIIPDLMGISKKIFFTN